MARKLKTLIIILLLPLWGVSQTGSTETFPQVRVIKGDTIFLFTHEQVKEFDKTYERLDECNELSKNYQEEIELLNSDNEVCQALYQVQEEEIETLMRIKDEQDGQITILTSENKKLKKKNKLLKKTRTLFTIGGTVLGTVIGGVTMYCVTK